MAHLSPQELLAKFRAARAAGESNRGNPDQLRLHRELVEACPAFTPNLLQLARLLRLVDEPGTDAEEMLAEVQRLLEQAVQASDRSADTLIELAYFLDTHRDSPDEARQLLEEGASKALSSLEDAWVGMIRLLEMEKRLPQALELSARAEKLFPDSGRIMGAVWDARQAAVTAGLLPPEAMDP
jgi:thioredoxin-like negative regulator of GroEL